MALTQQTITVQPKAGNIASYGRGTWDSGQPAATLVGAYVETDESGSDRLRQSGASARARIDQGVVTVDIHATVNAGPVPVVVTINA